VKHDGAGLHFMFLLARSWAFLIVAWKLFNIFECHAQMALAKNQGYASFNFGFV